MLSMAVISGLTSTGLDAIDLGIVPTPSLQNFVRTRGMAGGIVITASHNPPEFNGIKCISPDGTEMSREEELSIEATYASGCFQKADWRGIGKVRQDGSANASYVAGVVSALGLKRKLGVDIAIDCGNGASCFTSPKALRSIGCSVQTLNAQPDGAFPGRPSEPTEENLRDLMGLCKSGGFDIGIAHDGDADRVVLVDEKGGYVSGDSELALMSSIACRRAKGGCVIVPVDTSRAVQEAVEREGGELIYTKVGSPGIARKMMEVECVLGGEANGGIIFPEFQLCRDGLFAAASMARALSESGEPLSKMVARLPRKTMKRWKTPCPSDRFDSVMAALSREYPNGRMVDGLLVEEKGHWALFRPSGTEPIMRLTLEASDPNALAHLFEKFSSALRTAVADAN
jgi:phosphomannomutase/phosphoglucomutase